MNQRSTARSRVAPGTIALVGVGRAGSALGVALVDAGFEVVAVAGRAVDSPSVAAAARRFGATACSIAEVAREAAIVVLATPDAAIGDAAASVLPGLRRDAVVIHCSGSRGLEVLAPIAEARDDVMLGVLHPLQTLPSAEVGAARLGGAWAAVTGPPEIATLATRLGMHPFSVSDVHRDRYHAAACVASNHLVALLGQVERLAAAADVPFAAFEPLVRAAVDHAFALGPRAALTGPVSRGDVETVRRHLGAVADDEQLVYRALATSAARLAEIDDPELVELVSPSGAATAQGAEGSP